MLKLRSFYRNGVFIYNDPMIVGDVILQRVRCCWQLAIFKPWVWTQFDAVVIYCSFLIPRSDGHRLTTLNFICLYIYI